MSKLEIEEHRINLVESYECNDGDIDYGFSRIQDENDEDRDDCLWLKYKMKCVVHGKPVVREIFSIKLPIPENIRQQAEQMRRANANKRPAPRQRRAKPLAIEAPVVEAPVEESPVVEAPASIVPANAPAVVRPKLKKPARRK
jgi:hypothetical protein